MIGNLYLKKLLDKINPQEVNARLDEYEQNIHDIGTHLDELFITVTKEIPYTISANSYKSISFDIETPEGYHPFGVISYVTNHTKVFPSALSPTNCVLSSYSANEVTQNLVVKVAYYKENIL